MASVLNLIHSSKLYFAHAACLDLKSEGFGAKKQQVEVYSSANPNYKQKDAVDYRMRPSQLPNQSHQQPVRSLRANLVDNDDAGIFLPTKESLIQGSVSNSETQVQASSWDSWDPQPVVVKAPVKAEDTLGGLMVFTVNNSRIKDIEKDTDVYEPSDEEDELPDTQSLNLNDIIQLEEKRQQKAKQAEEKLREQQANQKSYDDRFNNNNGRGNGNQVVPRVNPFSGTVSTRENPLNYGSGSSANSYNYNNNYNSNNNNNNRFRNDEREGGDQKRQHKPFKNSRPEDRNHPGSQRDNQQSQNQDREEQQQGQQQQQNRIKKHHNQQQQSQRRDYEEDGQLPEERQYSRQDEKPQNRNRKEEQQKDKQPGDEASLMFNVNRNRPIYDSSEGDDYDSKPNRARQQQKEPAQTQKNSFKPQQQAQQSQQSQQAHQQNEKPQDQQEQQSAQQQHQRQQYQQKPHHSQKNEFARKVQNHESNESERPSTSNPQADRPRKQYTNSQRTKEDKADESSNNTTGVNAGQQQQQQQQQQPPQQQQQQRYQERRNNQNQRRKQIWLG